MLKNTKNIQAIKEIQATYSSNGKDQKDNADTVENYATEKYVENASKENIRGQYQEPSAGEKMEDYRCSCGRRFETPESYHEHLKQEIAQQNKESEGIVYEYYNEVGQ